MHPRFRFISTDANYSCGLGVLGNFHIDQNERELSDKELERYREHYFQRAEQRGAGFVMVAYIDSDLCRTMEELVQKRGWKEIFRSEKRYNRNSGNEFWFVVYDTIKGN